MKTITIDNYTEFTTLKYNQKVIFKVPEGRELKYVVKNAYLDRLNDYGKISEIFDILEIEDKDDLASEIYGYDTDGGKWPEFEHKDYEVAFCLVNYLFKRIEELNSKPEISLIQINKSTNLGIYDIKSNDSPMLRKIRGDKGHRDSKQAKDRIVNEKVVNKGKKNK